MTAKTVEFYFDFGSPAAYLAWAQLPALCDEAGAAVLYKPMLLGAVFQATGNRSPAEVPAKSRYVRRDFERHAARHGVPFNFNPHFPINTLVLMRGATAMQMQDGGARFGAFCACVFRAMWVDEKNMNDPAVVGAVLQGAGFDAVQFLAAVGQQPVKDRLKAVTEEAVARGVFGAPTFFVGDEMFFGQDRLDLVSRALRGA